jgi:Na+/melibiose symporter-like transporter
VGLFTFLRKLGGASAVFLIGIVLDLAGYTTGEGFSGAQGPTALLAIRGLSTLVPALFLGLAIWVALHYPLSRAAHAQIHRQLRDRNPSR